MSPAACFPLQVTKALAKAAGGIQIHIGCTLWLLTDLSIASKYP